VNTAFDIRRWEHDLTVKGAENFEELRSVVINAVKRVAGEEEWSFRMPICSLTPVNFA
jgi:hypothetical protein